MGLGAAATGGLVAAGVGAAGSVASGVIGGNAAKSAASTQAAAAQQASDDTMSMFNTTQTNLDPFISVGQGALNQLEFGLGIGNPFPSGQDTAGPLAGEAPGGLLQPLQNITNQIQPFAPTMAQLQQTPGYQFTLNQGLMATQNSFAAQGLGGSGAAIKGAANYAEGLAGTTYQQQFNNYWTNLQNQFQDTLANTQQVTNTLTGVAGSGQNAAANLGAVGNQTAQQAGQFLTSGAAAQAAGTVGAANATTSALNGLGNSATNFALLSQLGGNGLFGNANQPLTPAGNSNSLFG